MQYSLQNGTPTGLQQKHSYQVKEDTETNKEGCI